MSDLAEVGFVALALIGVALLSVPAALILAGVLGVLACERHSTQRAHEQARRNLIVRQSQDRAA